MVNKAIEVGLLEGFFFISNSKSESMLIFHFLFVDDNMLFFPPNMRTEIWVFEMYFAVM